MSGCSSCSCEPAAPSVDVGFRRVLWIALAVNAAMFGVEIVASLFASSVSLQADAIDFFSDATNYAITLSVLGMGVMARTRAALFKAATMAAFGLWVAASAAHSAVAGTVPEPFIMGPVAIAALIANVGVAVLLFRHRTGDSNRESVWLCSRNDAIANIAVFVAATGVFATNTGWPDILVGLGIAGLNLMAALRIFTQVRRERTEARVAQLVVREAAE